MEKEELGTFFFIIFLGSFFLVLAACSNATFDLREEKRKKRNYMRNLQLERGREMTATKMPLIVLGSLEKCSKILRASQNSQRESWVGRLYKVGTEIDEKLI